MPTGILDIIQQTEYMSFLNEAPEVTFFRVLFHRHTQFSTEIIEQPGESSGRTYSATLLKAGDLVHQIFIKVRVLKRETLAPEVDNSWVNNPRVEEVFSRHLPYQDYDEYFEAVKNLFPGIDEPLSGVFTEVSDMIDAYGYDLVRRAFILLDYIDLIQQIGAYELNGNDAPESVVRAFTHHPLRELVELNGLEPSLRKRRDILSPDLSPYLFEDYSLTIGGTVVDSYDPYYYSANTSLDTRYESQEYTRLAEAGDGEAFIIPLQFYFCKYNAMALPLCALRFHDVRIELTQTTLPFLQQEWEIDDVQFLVQYVHLSDRERLKFTTSSHEYLIHQSQGTLVDIPQGRTDILQELIFNKPCMQLIWFLVSYTDDRGSFRNEVSAFEDIQVLLGGDSVGNVRDPFFYQYVDPYRANTRIDPSKGIYAMSFALDCHSYQPSGSLNLGRIPHVYFRATIRPSIWEASAPRRLSLHVYSRCYNVLRISNGFSELAFA